MTGYGRGSAANEIFEITVELSSVNRKNLEINFALPKEWMQIDRKISEKLRTQIRRGKVNGVVQIQKLGQSSDFNWDDQSVVEILNRLKNVTEQNGISYNPDSNLLFQIACNVRSKADIPLIGDCEALVLKSLEDAISGLVDMRCKEGEALKIDIINRVQSICEWLENIKKEAKSVVEDYRTHLLKRLKLINLEIDLDDERILREIALFADRSDIAEEITRLDSHIKQFLDTIESDDLIGRKLDFILQEINREFNTIGSKASRYEISKCVVDCKNELERIREQVQNVE